MTPAIALLLSIWIVGLTFAIYVMVRNPRVLQYRLGLLRAIRDAGSDDIRNGRDPRWRFRYMDTVSYDDMMKQFWKPLDSFYQDRAFVTVGALPPVGF